MPVQVLDEDGDWLLVIYADYVQFSQGEGWMKREHLQELD